MSRTYTDKNGEKIKVSQEHLDVAVLLVDELQKTSPSRKCSWPKHKKMMEQEGFDDSDTTESYRQMIKFERKAKGSLPPIERVISRNVENKLEAIRDEIGNIQTAKLEARDDFNRLSKLKREWSRELLVTEAIERAVSNIQVEKFERNYHAKEEVKDERTLIVGLSDWHYGAIVDVEGHVFNRDVLEVLVHQYADKIEHIVKTEKITNVYVVGMGDLIENSYMRNNQGYSVEETFSQQVASASQLVITFLERVAEHVDVTYAAFNGNHDRLNTKNDTIYGDGAVFLSNEIVKMYVKASNHEHITYEESEPYHHIVRAFDYSFLFEHGDLTPMKRQGVLAERQQLHGELFDALICGHIHHFTQREVGHNQFVVTFGSLKGSDEYSLKTIGTSSSRSQGVILVDKDGYEIRRIAI